MAIAPELLKERVHRNGSLGTEPGRPLVDPNKLAIELRTLRLLRGSGVDMTLNEGRITDLEHRLGLARGIGGEYIPARIAR